MTTAPAAADLRIATPVEDWSAAPAESIELSTRRDPGLLLSSYLVAAVIPVFGLVLAARETRHARLAFGLALTSVVALAAYVALLSSAGA